MEWLNEPRTGLEGNVLNGLRLVVTFACAGASYLLVERPIRQRRFRWQQGPAIWWVAPAGIVLVGLTLIISARGSETPPSYLGGGDGGGGIFNATIPCVPSASELAAGRAAYAASPLPAGEQCPASPGRRVMVLGDSTACSLLPGLEAVAPTGGMTVGNAAVVGCGIVSWQVTSTAEIVPAGGERCPQLMADAEASARAGGTPDVVLWMRAFGRRTTSW